MLYVFTPVWPVATMRSAFVSFAPASFADPLYVVVKSTWDPVPTALNVLTAPAASVIESVAMSVNAPAMQR